MKQNFRLPDFLLSFVETAVYVHLSDIFHQPNRQETKNTSLSQVNSLSQSLSPKFLSHFNKWFTFSSYKY